MNNIEKKLDAIIDALGFDVIKVTTIRDGQDVIKGGAMYRNQTTTDFDYKLTKRVDNGVSDFAEKVFLRTGGLITKVPRSHFIEAAKSDIARGIDIKSANSSLQLLMKNFIEDDNE